MWVWQGCFVAMCLISIVASLVWKCTFVVLASSFVGAVGLHSSVIWKWFLEAGVRCGWLCQYGYTSTGPNLQVCTYMARKSFCYLGIPLSVLIKEQDVYVTSCRSLLEFGCNKAPPIMSCCSIPCALPSKYHRVVVCCFSFFQVLKAPFCHGSHVKSL